jgi:hypothetical protein
LSSNAAPNPMDLNDDDFELIMKALEAYPNSKTAGFMLTSMVEMIRPDKSNLAKEAQFDQMTEDQRRKEKEMQRAIIMPMAKIKTMQDDLRIKGTYHHCERPHISFPSGSGSRVGD